jgi:hypothetical protein
MLKIAITKRAGVVVQGKGPECKPPYRKKKKNNNNYLCASINSCKHSEEKQ